MGASAEAGSSEEGQASETNEEGEAEQADEASSVSETESTSILLLDLEGLFIDLLGLEVDLDEVELEIEAATGPGNLLGNLLSQVAGLLDISPGNLLRGILDRLTQRLLGAVSGSMEDNPIGGLASQLRTAAKDAIDQLPVEDLLRQVTVGLVEQVLEKSTPSSDGEGESEATS